jgi:hypothetical protein
MLNECLIFFLNQNGSVLKVKAPVNTGKSLRLKFSRTEREHHFVGQDTSRVKERT